LLHWLAQIAGVNPRELADAIFTSGSVILANPPEKVIRSDFKTYREDPVRFAVAQVEELGFGNFWKHAKELGSALERLRVEEASPSPACSSPTSTRKTHSSSSKATPVSLAGSPTRTWKRTRFSICPAW